MPLAPAQFQRLRQFEHALDPQHPDRSAIPARILGYGEISTVFAIDTPELRGWAFKRLPLFDHHAEIENYRAVFAEYNRLLEQDIGLRLPPRDEAILDGARGRPIFYIIQKQFPADSIGNRVLRALARERVPALVTRVLREARKVWDFNRRQTHAQIAIDGQISNWVIEDVSRLEDTPLTYLDTSTPLLRINGVEQLDTELFLRSAPSFLVWILRLLFVKEVMNRYYDFHRNTVDLIANFYKEQRADVIPDAIRAANDFFANHATDLAVAPLTERKVRDYYKEDALIWSLYFSMRKIDRFLRTRLLRREYPYILPEKIER